MLPQLLAGLGADCVDTRIRSRHEHFAVMDQRLRFLAALLLAAEGERPSWNQLGNRVGVDLGQ